MRIVFLGTPDFAVLPLSKLYGSGHEIAAVITQPDRAVNRKGKLLSTPVKIQAQSLGLTVHAFPRIKTKESVDTLKSLNADLFVTCAYGQILTQEVLDIPKFGTFNIHGSLLPKYRGAAPVQWAIINGEPQTGVTIMRTELGVDTGDIILKKPYSIKDEDTTESVLSSLSSLGADALLEAVDRLAAGTITYEKQDEDLATYSPMLRRVDGELDFSQSATEVRNRVRALSQNPGCYTYCDDILIKIHDITVLEGHSVNDDFGKIINADCSCGLTVKCGTGTVRINELQAAGCRRMDCKDYLRGRRITPGSYLTPEC